MEKLDISRLTPPVTSPDQHAINLLLTHLDPAVPFNPSLLEQTAAQSHLLVARISNQIVGMATLALIGPTLTGRHGHMADVVVHPDFRGHGIGASLIKNIIALGQGLDLDHLDFTSSPNKKAANHLYLQLGAERRNTNVYTVTYK